MDIVCVHGCVLCFNHPRQGGAGNAWRLASAPYLMIERAMTVEKKIAALQRLLDSLSPDDKDRILEILRIALEIAQSPLSI